MDTYGDMVTLLLCFFVLLYSMSTISEDNWPAIAMSFNPSAAMAPTETSGNQGPMADPLPQDAMGLDKGMTQDEVDQDIEELYQSLKQLASQQSAISVTKGGGKVFITFNQTVFFDGNSPVLRKDAYPILDQVSGMLSKAARSIDEVRVLGHTAQQDANRPNNVGEDRALASSRATNVVIYVQEHSSLSPVCLISEGIGQWRPVATNQTAEGRAENRRVEMIISGRNLEQELQGDIVMYEPG